MNKKTNLQFIRVTLYSMLEQERLPRQIKIRYVEKYNYKRAYVLKFVTATNYMSEACTCFDLS